MVRQKENDVQSSVCLAYVAINITSLDNCILIDNFLCWYLIVTLLNRQMHLKEANCIN
jgi:hypothetical protein